jgi:hypothetical protein
MREYDSIASIFYLMVPLKPVFIGFQEERSHSFKEFYLPGNNLLF